MSINIISDIALSNYLDVYEISNPLPVLTGSQVMPELPVVVEEQSIPILNMDDDFMDKIIIRKRKNTVTPPIAQKKIKMDKSDKPIKRRRKNAQPPATINNILPTPRPQPPQAVAAAAVTTVPAVTTTERVTTTPPPPPVAISAPPVGTTTAPPSTVSALTENDLNDEVVMRYLTNRTTTLSENLQREERELITQDEKVNKMIDELRECETSLRTLKEEVRRLEQTRDRKKKSLQEEQFLLHVKSESVLQSKEKVKAFKNSCRC